MLPPASAEVAVAVLDSEPLWRLARARPGSQRAESVRALLRSAERGRHHVVVPSAVLVEVYRGGADDDAVDRVIAGARIGVVTTGRAVARVAARLLTRDGLDSCHVVDALVVAAAVRLGGDVVLTGDPDDLQALARDHRNVRVSAL